MTETAMRLEAPATAAGAPRCSAMVPVPLSALLGWPVDGYSLERCPEPAEGYYVGRCPCGHVRDGWLCARHAANHTEREAGGCQACITDPESPHECPLPLSRQGVPGNG